MVGSIEIEIDAAVKGLPSVARIFVRSVRL